MLFALSLAAAAQDTFVKTTLETSVPLADPAVVVTAKLLVDVPIGKHWSMSPYFQVGQTYAEAYIGPSLRLGEFQINASVGLETADMPLRVASWAFWSHERVTTLACVEYGGSGSWYLALATARFGPATIGAMGQRFEGIGPRASVTAKSFELYAAPLWDPEDESFNILSGLNWTP